MPTVNWTTAAADELERQVDKAVKNERKESRLLEKGYYDDAQLIEVTGGTSSDASGNNPQIRMKFLVDGDVEITRFPTFSTNGWEYAVRDIVATGIDVSSLGEIVVDDSTGSVTVDTDAIVAAIEDQILSVDNSFRVGVSVDEYNGKTKNGIYWMQNTTPDEVQATAAKANVGGFGFG